MSTRRIVMDNNTNNDNNLSEENIEQVDLSGNKSKEEELSEKMIKVAENIVNTEDKTNSFEKGEAKVNKSAAILCYLGPLIILPLANKIHKRSEYMHFHVNQGFNLILLYIVVFIFTGILTSMFKEVYAYGAYTPGWVSFVNYMLFGLTVVINIFGLFYTYKGMSKKLPLIGNFKFIK